tara:strand:- start:397 stop:807 length:411 start_codon:yes stop_codon:yes gene_type:complete
MSITITEVRNAQSLREDNLQLDVEINHPVHGWLPYTINPSDTDDTIDNSAIMGLIGSNFAAYVAPTQVELDADKAEGVRAERDHLLLAVDAIAGNVLRWSDLSSLQKEAWATYRQALLDVPQQAGFPDNITWPTEP